MSFAKSKRSVARSQLSSPSDLIFGPLITLVVYRVSDEKRILRSGAPH
jgi:hypothetical protein